MPDLLEGVLVVNSSLTFLMFRLVAEVRVFRFALGALEFGGESLLVGVVDLLNLLGCMVEWMLELSIGMLRVVTLLANHCHY